MAFVYGHPVSSTECVHLSDVPNQINRESLSELVPKLDSCRVCPGHLDSNYVDMAMSKKDKLSSAKKL